MLLARYNEDTDTGDASGDQSDDNALVVSSVIDVRRAMFEGLKRGRKTRIKPIRIRRSGISKRGNSMGVKTFGQRVIVKTHFVNHSRIASGGGGSVKGHLYYISRSGAGEDGERAMVMDQDGMEADIGEFVSKCKDDRHHFRMIISPENGDKIDDFYGYVGEVMKRAEKDLGTGLEWVTAVHYDTDNPHAHVLIRGVDDKGADLVIERDYIGSGFRRRAEEVAVERLGERSREEMEQSMAKGIDELRVVSVDRFIAEKAKELEEQGKEPVIDVRKKNVFGRSQFYEGLVKERLKFLATVNMAEQDPPGVYKVQSSYVDALRSMGERDDVIKKLYRVEGLEQDVGNVQLYKLVDGDGPQIEGRVEHIGRQDELTDRRYVVVRDHLENIHYVAMAHNEHTSRVEEGALIRVSPPKRSTGKSDHNIARMAEENGGVYDMVGHLEYVEQEMDTINNPETYVGWHIVRLNTLTREGVVKSLGDGRYEVPADVVAQGEALNKKMDAKFKKKHYPDVQVVSHHSPEHQIDAVARTFIDMEIWREQKGYACEFGHFDKKTLKAIEARKEWLVKEGYGMIQSNGTFAMRDGSLKRLKAKEMQAIQKTVSEFYKAPYKEIDKNESKIVHYLDSLDVFSGHYTVVKDQGHVSLIKSPRVYAEQGAEIDLSFNEGKHGKYASFKKVKERAVQKPVSLERDDNNEKGR